MYYYRLLTQCLKSFVLLPSLFEFGTLGASGPWGPLPGTFPLPSGASPLLLLDLVWLC